MKKKKQLLSTLFLIVGIYAYSQNFTYNKIAASGHILKMKGKITVTDTLVAIYTNGIPANFTVKKEFDANNIKKFKAINVGSDTEIRITLNNVVNPTKKNTKMLLLETKDPFSNTYGAIAYYLKLTDEH